jgi:hypothetical protein
VTHTRATFRLFASLSASLLRFAREMAWARLPQFSLGPSQSSTVLTTFNWMPRSGLYVPTCHLCHSRSLRTNPFGLDS